MFKKLCIKKNQGFTLVELMIVVAIIGILAAIAIPAFLRYIKQSKTAEAEGIMKKMAEGSKAYFTSEQKYSPAGGDQPWHAAGAATSSTAPGLPVAFSSRVFPGGSAFTLSTSVSACGAGAPDVAAAPQGGAKQLPCAGTQPASTTTQAAALNKLRVTIQDPLYFQYAYASTGVGPNAIATINALANFTTDPALGHNINQVVSIDSVTQEVKVGPSVVTNEFE